MQQRTCNCALASYRWFILSQLLRFNNWMWCREDGEAIIYCFTGAKDKVCIRMSILVFAHKFHTSPTDLSGIGQSIQVEDRVGRNVTLDLETCETLIYVWWSANRVLIYNAILLPGRSHWMHFNANIKVSGLLNPNMLDFCCHGSNSHVITKQSLVKNLFSLYYIYLCLFYLKENLGFICQMMLCQNSVLVDVQK